MKIFKKVLKLVGLLLVLALCVILGMFISKKDIGSTDHFFPLSVKGQTTLNCELTSTGGIYDLNSSFEKKNEIRKSLLKKDEETIKFTFKDYEGQTTRILSGDAMGVEEEEGLILSNTEELMNIISFWGSDKSGVQTYTIYKNSGFFTFTRSGNLILLGDSLMYGYGRCY